MDGKGGHYCCRDISEFLFSCFTPVTRGAADESHTCSCLFPSLILLLRCSSATSERVQALRYLQLTRQLLSCSADGGIAVWNMDTQREEVGDSHASRVPGAVSDCFSVSAGASVVRQRLVSEVRAAVLLEHQADVGQQDHRAPAGKGASGGRCPLRLPSVTPRLCFRSTTAGSAERPSVGNAVPNAPRTPSWASSSPCGCVTPALRPSEKKSESRVF